METNLGIPVDLVSIQVTQDAFFTLGTSGRPFTLARREGGQSQLLEPDLNTVGDDDMGAIQVHDGAVEAEGRSHSLHGRDDDPTEIRSIILHKTNRFQ